ncbi:MAG: heme exporter protein CcmB [Rickettsiales bacterium]
MFFFELKKQIKQINDLIFNLFFFLITTTIFVFAVDYDFAQQKIYAAGITLTILLLAILIVVEKNLKEDFSDGILEQLYIFNRAAGQIILAKYFSFLIFIYILLLATPLVLVSFALNISDIKIFVIIIAAMLPLITALCFLGSIFTFKIAGQKNFLIYIIILPLLIPEIIFIMLILENNYVNYDFARVQNYLEYMLFLNLVLLPICYFLAKNSLKSALKYD